MKKIKLTQGKFAVVDDSDYEWLNKWKWSLHGIRHLYARGFVDGRKQLMHRIILNAPVNLEIDHISGNGLDNRRCNLRICTRSQNQMNAHPRKGTSNYKGVHWNSGHKKWSASIRLAGKLVALGDFESEYEASKAYNSAAEEHFRQFAFSERR